jgi:DNA-binding XRE family transcriptional regulator
MKQLVSPPVPNDTFGALLRAGRNRAWLSQEQLAARAGLSERTVRDLEAGRVRSPRTDTVRLLADALQSSQPERGKWIEAAGGVNHQRAEPAAPGVGGPARGPGPAPAQLPLTACGFGRGNSPTRCHSSAGEFQAKIVAPCEREDQPADQVPQDVDLIDTAVRARPGLAGRMSGPAMTTN